jgi:hypothetical protein
VVNVKKFIQELIDAGADFSTKKALKRSLRLIGLKPDNVERLYIDFKNDYHKERFHGAEPEQKILFLPQCLRKTGCKATLDENGYHCANCSAECKVSAIKAHAENLGYKVFVCPGGSMIAKIIVKYRPKAVLGVACIKEIVMAAEELEQRRIPYQAVELLKDGCVSTDVDVEHVFSLL